jgi:hypothetical protein
MQYTKIQIGDSVIISDCTHIHPELHDGANGRVVSEADDNGEFLIDFWVTRKRIPPLKIKQHLPKLEVIQPTIEVDNANVLDIISSLNGIKRIESFIVDSLYEYFSRSGEKSLKDLTNIRTCLDKLINLKEKYE